MTVFWDLAARLGRRVAARARCTLRPPAVAMWRAAVVRRGQRGVVGTGTLLVLAPHPDDETLGCGATIAAARAAGQRVVVAVITDGRSSHVSAVVGPDRLAAIRERESQRACRRLGVADHDLEHLRFPEASLGERYDDVVGCVRRLIERVRPDVVLVTCADDWHADHRVLHAAAAHAVEGTDVRLLEYPVWTWVDGPVADPGRRGPGAWLADARRAGSRLRRPVLLSPARGGRRAKRAAIAEYRSQTTNFTGEPGWAVMDRRLISRFLGDHEVFFESVQP